MVGATCRPLPPLVDSRNFQFLKSRRWAMATFLKLRKIHLLQSLRSPWCPTTLRIYLRPWAPRPWYTPSTLLTCLHPVCSAPLVHHPHSELFRPVICVPATICYAPRRTIRDFDVLQPGAPCHRYTPSTLLTCLHPCAPRPWYTTHTLNYFAP